MYTILIVDDEANLLEVLAVALENMGYGTVTAETAEEALAVLEEREVHLVLSDLRLPGLNGRELMEKVKAANPDLPVVIMTAYASLKEAVEIIKEGAFDYTVKPFELDALEATIASALRYYALGRDNRDLREQLQTASAGQFVGQSPAYLALLRNVSEVSASSANVLITGESGTGKELVARAIHFSSPRSQEPFVSVNCMALNPGVLESELFGHEKGSFTGAVAMRRGRFEQASGGTLFLDEVGELTFREDLYYRLNVVHIPIPPLRERREDIPLLVAHFAEKAAKENGIPPKTFSTEALNHLSGYEWPGNIRQLQNVVERCLVLVPGDVITLEDLPAEIRDEEAQFKSAVDLLPVQLDLADTLERIEAALIRRALVRADFVQAKAAELLGISKSLMQYKLKKYSITGH